MEKNQQQPHNETHIYTSSNSMTNEVSIISLMGNPQILESKYKMFLTLESLT